MSRKLFGRVDARLAKGHDRDREALVPFHHINHRQSLCPRQDHLIATGNGKLSLALGSERYEIVLETVFQGYIQPFLFVEALGLGHI